MKTISADYQPSEVNRPKEFNLQFLNFTVNCSIMIMGKELASDGSTSGSVSGSTSGSIPGSTSSGSIAGLVSGSINELLDSAINEDIEETLKSENIEDEDLEEIETEIMTDQSDQPIKTDEKIDQKIEENQSSESRSSPEIIEAIPAESDKITDLMSDKSAEKPEVVKKSTSLDEALDKLESAKNAAGKKILPKFLQKKFASVEEVGTGKFSNGSKGSKSKKIFHKLSPFGVNFVQSSFTGLMYHPL